MTLEQCFQKIEGYLKKDEGLCLVVDAQRGEDEAEVIQRYNVGDALLLPASAYCAHDELPRLDELLNDLKSKDGLMIVTGATSFLKLQGEGKLRQFMRELLGMWIRGHVIFISFQCGKFLPDDDPRLARRIIKIDGEGKDPISIVFARDKAFILEDCEAADGIELFAEAAEKGSSSAIYVLTAKGQEALKNSLFGIDFIESAYGALAARDAATSGLPKSLGTDEEWGFALNLFKEASSWEEVIDRAFGSHKKLNFAISSYKDFSKEEKWLYLVALKMYGASGDWCLEAAARSGSIKEFIGKAACCLLSKSVDDKDFWECHESRKKVLSALGNPDDEIARYCNMVSIKGIDAICYLTDSTQREKEAIFECLDLHGQEIRRDKLMERLRRVYPDLYSYLSPYRFENDDNGFLTRYFDDYKWQKAINKVSPEFLAQVESLAISREYNRFLPPRASVLDGLNKDNAKVYFMDAMGVEYLSYILSVCAELGLDARITVCTAELPSITSQNKDFVDYFKALGVPVVQIKEIDDIKHRGKYGFDFYRNSKLPTHLIRELEVIRRVLSVIKNDISSGELASAFMIADHGATRLAVLHDTENVWAMPANGEHSGRCCPKSGLDERPDFAVDAGDFWALANYDRFKGGRKANVEAHGGATLEEICVPVIELLPKAERIRITLMPAEGEGTEGEVPVIFSYRRKAAIRIFASGCSLQDPSIVVEGKRYPAEKRENNYYLAVLDLSKPGPYQADVLSSNTVVARGLAFILKSKGVQEVSLF